MDTLMGRPTGAGNATDYLAQKVWEYKGDFNKDIRNSIYNVQRVYYWLNPASKYFSQPITVDNVAVASDFNPSMVGPHFKKVVSAVHKSHLGQDATSKQWHDNGLIFKDWYLMRLAETYLLRAEAHFRKNEYQTAADDINMVRNRAKATPVTAADVQSLGLDLILDERVRELHMEEFRFNTLLRMGKLAEYLRKYNTVVITKGYTIDDHLNLLPIPNREIEANKEVVLEQNPGYN
jgi:starch-binding outer membrane protein, SusD/RagB family